MDRINGIKKKKKSSCPSRLSLFKKKTNINMDGQDKEKEKIILSISFIPVQKENKH